MPKPNRADVGTSSKRTPEYVLLSDVHLVEIAEPPEEGWWAYKAPEARQDGALVRFLGSVQSQRPPIFAYSHVIFNGDSWDFDSVYSSPDDVAAPAEGMPSTVPGAVYKMGRMIDDHPAFIAAVAEFLAAGNEVTFVMGNHDRELCFPEVQTLLRQRVAAAAPAGNGADVATRLHFEPWFIHIPGVLYAEHGQQYDMTCSYSDVLDARIPPDRQHATEVEVSFGSAMARRVLSRLGTFNPFNDESFVLGLGGYLRHFMQFYFPKRPMFRPYFSGTFAVLYEVWRRGRRMRARTPDPERYARYAVAKSVDPAFMAMLGRLSSQPLSERPLLLIHELWLDRFAALGVMLALIIVAALNVQTWSQGLMLSLLIPISFVLLRLLGRGSLALQERGRWGLVAEQIGAHLKVPVIAFGHSHRPERRPLMSGGRYYNLGSWAPLLEADEGTTLARARRFLVIRPTPQRLYVAFQRWDDGDIAAF